MTPRDVFAGLTVDQRRVYVMNTDIVDLDVLNAAAFDEDEQVREATLMVQALPMSTIASMVERWPELERLAIHSDSAPPRLLERRPLLFVDEMPLNRYLQDIEADEHLRQAVYAARDAAGEAGDSTTTLKQAIDRLQSAG